MLNNTNISKYLTISLVLLSAFLFVLTIQGFKRLGYIGKEIYPQRTIMASGEGTAYAIPDIATFSFSSTESGATVQAAQEKVDALINKALASVKAADVEDKDIKTTGYNAYPKYEWEEVICSEINYPKCPPGKNVLKGYEVSQTITVKVRDTAKAGDLITKVGTTGVSNISGLDFTVDDREKYVAQAREEAIVKAKENAKQMAKDLGVKLGKLLYFNENSGYPGPYYSADSVMGMGGGAGAPVMKAQLPQGETKITTSISLTYEME